MIHLVRGFGIAALAYLVVISLHFLREAWIIVREGFNYPLPECRRWWCPDGLLNRRRATRERRKNVTRDS